MIDDELIKPDKKKFEDIKRKYILLGYLDDPVKPDKNRIDIVFDKAEEESEEADNK